MKKSRFKKYLFPAMVFQSVIMAGGYGTGRELARYFLPGGTLGGFLALAAVVPLVWGGMCAAVFELCRREKAYDYNALASVLLKRGWRLYELCYFLFLLLVLAVALASSGEIIYALTGLPVSAGAALSALAIGLISLSGEKTVSKVFSGWSVFLMAVYLAFFAVCAARFGISVPSSVRPGWFTGGVKYAFYNLGSMPAVLFAVKEAETSREAVTAGALCGVMGVIPALFLYFPLITFLPGSFFAEVPTAYILGALKSPLLAVLMDVALLGTLAETGVGLIFSVCRRFSPEPRPLSDALCASALLLCGFALSLRGMGELIEKGYGAMSWVFMAILAVPLGVYWLKTGILDRFSSKKGKKGTCNCKRSDI